jgi:hypothetical protein
VDFELVQYITVDAGYCCLVTLVGRQDVPKKIRHETRMIAFEVDNIQRCIEGPVVFFNVVDLSEGAVSPGYHPWSFGFRFAMTPCNT